MTQHAPDQALRRKTWRAATGTRQRTSAQDDAPKHPVIFACFAYYLMSLAFEGPYRFVLSAAHLETLVYVRDLIAVLTVLHHIISRATSRGNLLTPVVIAFYLLLAHAVLSLWISVPLGSVLFSIKVFMAVLYGMAVSEALDAHKAQLKTLFAVLFTISTIGVLLNYFYGIFPWEGENFESAFGSIQTTKVWWAGGERRLSGFSRASYSAAMAIGLTGGFLIALTPSRAVRVIAYACGMAAIYLTTSKGMVVAFGVCGLWLIVSNDSPVSQKIGLKIVLLLALLSILIPVVSDLYDGNPSEIRKAPPLLSSFWDRITESWPQTFAQLEKNYGYLFGKGLGGAGMGIKMGANNPNTFVPIDNIFWYTYSIFGAATLYYGFYTMRRIFSFPQGSPAVARPMIAMAIIMIGYGLTSVMFEDAFFSILFGVLLAWPQKKISNP